MPKDEKIEKKSLEDIVKKILNIEKIISITALTEGRANDIYEVKTENGDFILRLMPENKNETFEKTANAMRFVENEIYNKIIKLSEDKKILILDKIEGNSLQSILNKMNEKTLPKEEILSENDIHLILSEAFQSSRMMSTKKVPKGFGHINENLQGWANSAMEEVFRGLTSCFSLIISKKYIDIETTKKIGNLFYNNIELFLNVEPRFVYCDLNFGNIIVENKKFKSLIDFDFCISGDPVRMFEIVFKYTNEKYKNVLIKAMKLNAKEKVKLRLYIILSTLNTLKIYCSEYLGKNIDSKIFNEENMRYNKKFLMDLLNNKIEF
ncbi:MAG: hypothetical protein PHN56_01000 [Candidatus Nanoarchaeia archaeon]|nr:hypothetical protein [Candidatus Nanoarchaeia archaeon]